MMTYDINTSPPLKLTSSSDYTQLVKLLEGQDCWVIELEGSEIKNKASLITALETCISLNNQPITGWDSLASALGEYVRSKKSPVIILWNTVDFFLEQELNELFTFVNIVKHVARDLYPKNKLITFLLGTGSSFKSLNID